MKKKLLFLAILLLSIILLYSLKINDASGLNITSPEYFNPLPGINTDKFIITGMDCGLWNTNQFNADLNYNSWHRYTSAVAPWMGSQGWEQVPVTIMPPGIDRYNNPASLYGPYVSQIITANKSDGLRTIMDRPKIQYTTQGQRSDYQCETESYLTDPDYWSYTYNIVSDAVSRNYPDNSQWGNGARVRYCRTSNSTNDGNWVNSEGYVVSGLKANREQANLMWTYTQRDSVYEWYVMPKIRIPVGVPDNARICRIEVYNWDGNEIVTVRKDILAGNFKNNNNPYDGRYLDGEYYFSPNPFDDPYAIEVPKNTISFGAGRHFEHWNDPDLIQTDFRVWWYGECDMWIDYVRVENLPAHQLFKGLWDQEIKNEVDLALTGYQQTGYLPNHFYYEEFEFNTTPCIRYVNGIIKQRSSQFGVDLRLMMNLNYQLYTVHNPGWAGYTPQQIRKFLIDGETGIKNIVGVCYPLEGWDGTETEAWSYDLPNLPRAKHPITLSNAPYDRLTGVLSDPVPPAEYDTWLQEWFENQPEGTGMIKTLKYFNTLTKLDQNITMTFLHQSHLWWNLMPSHKLKEPTNEEIDLMANLAVSYGMKGMQYFYQWSFNNFNDPNSYARGIMDGYAQERINAYGQNKYQQIKNTSARLNKWGDNLMNFENSSVNSYSYYRERTQLLNETYFNDIRTYTPDINDPMQPSGIEEPVGSRYLQASVFRKFEEPYSNYFMLVNRRCSPYYVNGDNGGRRYFKVSFKESELQYFTNWKIVELENNTVVTTFNKNGSPYIDLGWYKPGEGKLYKLAPVMVDGGTLAYDENLNMTPPFECYNTVYNGGKNISLYPSNTINFTHLGRIIMGGGSFQSGLLIGDQGRVTLNSDGLNAPVISFENCADVRIYNTDVSSYYNTSYLFSITNCTLTDIQYSSFTPPENGGGIGFFAAYSMLPPDFNLNISNNNHFNMTSSTLPALNIMAFGGIQIPLICSGNYFTSQGNNSTTAINLLNVSGGILQNNSITGFYYGINALTTNTALYHNNISSSGNTSYGLNLTSGTVVDMSYTGDYLLGANVISNTGSTSSNIYVDNSYFLMNSGYNTFNISSNSGSYHLSGTFPLSGGLIDLDNKLNCFKQNQSNSTPVKSVNWYGGGEVQFNFLPYSCNDNQEEDGMAAADMGDGIIDSIAFKNGTPLNVYDSLGLEMRKRNYIAVINMCTRILNDPPDTIQIIDAVSKLYMATISTDTTETGITSLKDFYLNVIMNNPSNSALVRNCNYYVQKCKVNLHQYSSAMSGFQQIISENPYSYEALVAHWDYMAVYILDSLSGSGEMGDGDDRNSKLKKEQKIYVKEVIRNIYENERTREENNINKLVIEVNNGNEVSKVILEKKRTLKEVVQNQSPHNMFEHINIVNSDIKKVFGKSNSENRTGNNNIPMVFRISQNYPNPFNPTTKINYDLPKDSKVNIVIYDILGREVKRLVNNELKTAGSYIVDFNAINYASGVYFYRIEAEEPNGSKFVDSKKMVLLK